MPPKRTNINVKGKHISQQWEPLQRFIPRPLDWNDYKESKWVAVGVLCHGHGTGESNHHQGQRTFPSVLHRCQRRLALFLITAHPRLCRQCSSTLPGESPFPGITKCEKLEKWMKKGSWQE